MINIFDEVVFSPGQKFKLAALVSQAESRLERTEYFTPKSQLWSVRAEAETDLTPGIEISYHIVYQDIGNGLEKTHYFAMSYLDSKEQPCRRELAAKCMQQIAKHLGFNSKEFNYGYSRFHDRAVLTYKAAPKKG